VDGAGTGGRIGGERIRIHQDHVLEEECVNEQEKDFMSVKAIPEGHHTVTPYLRIKNAAAAIDFYKKAFGATEVMRMPGPSGALMHAELQIGDSKLMLSDEFPQWGVLGPETLKGTSVTIHLYVPDVDA